MSKLTELIERKLIGSPCALPVHLRNWNGTGKPKPHTDWPPLLNRIPRSFNAYGPRCPKSSKGYRAWPPKLVEGFGVARWELAQASSIIMIPALVNVHVKANQVYGKTWRAIEMAPYNKMFLKEFDVFLTHWQESHVYEMETNPGEIFVSPDQYSPSALQKFSPNGFMRLDPDYHHSWRVLKKRELPLWPEDGEDTVLMIRKGYRPDHLDVYYNKSFIAGGLHWE